MVGVAAEMSKSACGKLRERRLEKKRTHESVGVPEHVPGRSVADRLRRIEVTASG